MSDYPNKPDECVPHEWDRGRCLNCGLTRLEYYADVDSEDAP